MSRNKLRKPPIARRKSPILEKYGKDPGGPQTPGAKAKREKTKKAAKRGR